MRKRLAAILASSTMVQLWLAYRYYGFLTGDEVEVLSEAFRRARGLHYQPWDIRSLFVPDLVVAPVVWLASLAGVHDVSTLIIASSLPFIACSAVTIWLVYRLALRWGADEHAATIAALLTAAHWIPLGFGSTAYPRTLAAMCVVLAALVVERWPFAAGALVALAFTDRFSEVVFLAPILLSLWHRRGNEQEEGSLQTSPARTLSAVPATILLLVGFLLTTALTAGVYDWFTWGAPFRSVLNFARLTLVAPDFASRVKYQAPWWYLANVVRWCSPLLLPLLWFARRSRAIWFVVIPLLVFSAIRHKELRYLQVMIPFLMIGAALGFAVLFQRHPWLARAAVTISLLWNVYDLRYFARKSQPAVDAARWLAADPNVHSVAVSQLWAFGDKLYFGDRIGQADLGTPPDLGHAISPDAIALYETDLDVPARLVRLHTLGYTPVRTFRDHSAKAVVVFRKESVSSLRRPMVAASPMP